MLILIPCKFLFFIYSWYLSTVCSLCRATSLVNPNHLRDFGFLTLVTDYCACRQLGLAGDALPSSLLVAFIFQIAHSNLSISFRPSRHILFSFPSWSYSGQTSSIPCLGLWIIAIGSCRPWCCCLSGGRGVKEFWRGVWTRQWLKRIVGLPLYTLVFYSFSRWNKWV